MYRMFILYKTTNNNHSYLILDTIPLRYYLILILTYMLDHSITIINRKLNKTLIQTIHQYGIL